MTAAAMMTPRALAEWACRHVTVLTGLDPAEIEVSPLRDDTGGPMLCVVELSGRDESLLVRLPPDVAARLGGAARPAGPWSPETEARHLRLVAPLGLTPPTLQVDGTDGLCVHPLWPGVPLQEALARDPEVVARLAQALRLLHGSGLRFSGPLDPYGAQDAPWPEAARHGLPERGLGIIRDLIGHCRGVLSPDAGPAVPCLHAPSGEAGFDTGTRVLLTDWRASALGDPHFDLARLIERAALADDDAAAFLDAYLGPGDSLERDRVTVFRLVAVWESLREALADMALGRGETMDPDTERRRLRVRFDGCLKVLERPAWTAAMDRLTTRRREAGRVAGVDRPTGEAAADP